MKNEKKHRDVKFGGNDDDSPEAQKPHSEV